MNLLGQLKQDHIAKALGTGFSRFSSPLGIQGLCKVTGDRLEILACEAVRTGDGLFRNFIAEAKKSFTRIDIWFVTSDVLDDCLPRYGFRKWEEKQTCNGELEHMEGFRWDK